MKPIIILILSLIFQFANGQVKPMTEKMWKDSSYHYELIGSYSEYFYDNESIFNIKPVKSYLIYAWDKYSKECYADSTLLKHQHFMPEGERYCIVDWECLNPDHYRDYYIHTIPTFSGFMKWLQNKVK
jgi:hypothetical protein